MNFKLIAIRPLKGCDEKFLKNLQVDRFYQFGNDFDFSEFPIILDNRNINTHKTISELYNQEINRDLYGKKDLNISISAIVGKNGSGKSSLMELIYVTFFKISRITKIIEDEELAESPKVSKIDDLMFSAELRATAILLEENFENKDFNLNDDSHLKYKYNSLFYELHKRMEEKEIIDYDKNTNDLHIELFYVINDVNYILKLHNNNCNLITYKSEDGELKIIDDFKIKTKSDFKIVSGLFFYNLVINYSIYGLNSKDSGLWIEKLFHKNDSYQTPIVLNPFRNDGNIDINSENYLVNSRLLALIFAKDVNNKTIAEGKEIKRIKLKFIDKKLSDTLVYWEYFYSSFFPKLYTYFFTDPIDGKMPDLNTLDCSTFVIKQGKIYKKTLEYILKKIDNIAERYPTFKKFIAVKDDEFFNKELENELIVDIFQDRSHISLKIKQALNFYHFQNYVDDNILNLEETFPIDELQEKINSYTHGSDFVDLIEFIPPPFFEIELFFDTVNDNNNFSNLSSGEKQKIYSLNSVVYHLRNLLSVNKNPKKKELIVYNNFNIILDEIELYYHPELQRTFIFDLIEYIRKIDFENRYADCIPNVNIIFITHSPFILSDIPKQNILFLDIDKKTNKSQPQIYDQNNTFAGNIHEMLTNGFFLESTKGKFAISKINEFLDFYKKKEDLIESDFLNQREYFKSIIQMVGEDYIRKILQNQFDELDKIFNPKYLIEKRRELREEIDKIDEQINSKSS